MPNTPQANSWTTEEFEKLIDLVKAHPFIYNELDPSRKNILARESTWEKISTELSKPVDDCKKRWRTIRDGYMKSVRLGNSGKGRIGILSKLDFLNEIAEVSEDVEDFSTDNNLKLEEASEQQVIMDNQEYYEITLVDESTAQESTKTFTRLPTIITDKPPKKIGRKNCGRKRNMPPPPTELTPIKILPKPMMVNGPKIIQYLEEPKVLAPPPSQPQRSETLDSLIEKVLKEHTNEIDVFFRSMAASVKKLQPNLIPKVKMEVCNVIAKYEMQSFDNKGNSF